MALDPVAAAKALLPRWLRDDPLMLAQWEEGIAQVGYSDAIDYVRQTPLYQDKFPGMIRDDGTQRFTNENEYLATIESYERDLTSVGINPDVMRDKFVDLIEQDVSPDEFFSERVRPMYDRVIRYGPDLMQRYAADHGIEMTPEALIASALDPDLETKIFDKAIGLTEIKAESDRVFGMTETNRWSSLMEEIQGRGKVDAAGAQSLFQRAGHLIPTLEILAKRHADVDDNFDLEEFTDATLFEDPTQIRRIQRLQAQEGSLFTGGMGLSRDRTTGSLTGLQQL